jgi:aryl-alcohol dehydrogenase-like predicted oxidoreductase
MFNQAGRLPNSLRREALHRQIDGSLKRLRTDVIDLYQIPSEPDAELEEGWETLVGMVKAGKIRYIGGNFLWFDEVKRLGKIAPMASVQFPYSIMWEPGKDFTRFLAERSIALIGCGPLAHGVLSGSMTVDRYNSLPASDTRVNSVRFLDMRLARGVQLASILTDIGREHGRTTAEVAISLVLHDKAVTAVAVGARSPEQVKGILGGADLVLTPRDRRRVKQFLPMLTVPLDRDTPMRTEGVRDEV